MNDDELIEYYEEKIRKKTIKDVEIKIYLSILDKLNIDIDEEM